VDQRRMHFERRREYPMSVDEAWRLLADTDHLNRTIGLPAVTFSPLDGPAGRFTRDARARAFGVVSLSWTEYPFDWVRGRGYRVRREFTRGPLAVVEAGVELAPAEGGVRVTAYADYVPANWTGRFLWRLGNATVTDLLAFCDEYLARREAGKPDPVPVPRRRPSVDRARLDRVSGALASAPIDQELVARLRERILEGADDQVAGVRPAALAAAWGADRREVLRLLLHATRAGLFELRWEVLCPNCRVSKAEAPALAQLPNEFHCETCGIAFDADFDQRVELRFTVHPSVREAENAVYCVGGPLRMPHVLSQQYLRAGEDRKVDLRVDGPLRLRAVAGPRHLRLVPYPAASRPAPVRLTYAQGRWSGPHSLADGEEDTLRLPAGSPVELRNQTGGPLLAVLEDVEPSGEATTAAEVTAMQEFRDLFSGEVLAPGQQLAVRDVALVFSDLRGSTSMYEGVGDAAAYSRVNRHFEFIRQRIVDHRGAVLKTMGDAVMGAFVRLDDAAAAALSMQREIDRWCESQEIQPPLVLKVGVHHGPAIAVTSNDRLDYFGRTVNVAARLGGESRGGDVVFLREVYEELGPEVAGHVVQRFRARLRGLPGERELVRAAPAPARTRA
jgi:adenylate cyclase